MTLRGTSFSFKCEWCDQTWDRGSVTHWCQSCQYTVCSLCLAPKRALPSKDSAIPTGDKEGQQAASSKRAPQPKAKPLAARTAQSSPFNFEDIHPPMCARCHGRAWPGARAKSGKFHCAAPKCMQGLPPDWLPECTFCGSKTWDGQWRGVQMCKLGKGFCCRVCWVKGCSDSERPQWERWFTHRQNFYGRAFPQDPSEWKLQVSPSAL